MAIELVKYVCNICNESMNLTAMYAHLRGHKKPFSSQYFRIETVKE